MVGPVRKAGGGAEGLGASLGAFVNLFMLPFFLGNKCVFFHKPIQLAQQIVLNQWC